MTNKLAKLTRYSWYFYRNYYLSSLTISVLCAFGLARSGTGNHIFFYIFWFKVFTLFVTFYFVNLYKKSEFYYYRNLGISGQILWIITLSFDFMVFIILLIIALKIS